MMLHPAIVIAPQCPEKMSWSNFSRTKISSETRLAANTDQTNGVGDRSHSPIDENDAVDSNRIYITGLSMGGFGTYDAIERYPIYLQRRFLFVVVVILQKPLPSCDMPIWIVHGAEDPAVNPSYSLDMLQALTKAGAHPGFTQYPE